MKQPVSSDNKATATTRVLGTTTCRGIPATITGTAGVDVLTGTGGRDVIVASAAGSDPIVGGPGPGLRRSG